MSRNEIEAWDRWVGPDAPGPRQQTGLVAQKRTIGPSRLCKVFWPGSMSRDERKDGDISGATAQSIPVDNVSPHTIHTGSLLTCQWDARDSREPFPEFVFVAYVQGQFPAHKEGELHRFAIQAARDAGVDHYWVACACMPNHDDVRWMIRADPLVDTISDLPHQ
jgi:hypothetical protein